VASAAASALTAGARDGVALLRVGGAAGVAAREFVVAAAPVAVLIAKLFVEVLRSVQSFVCWRLKTGQQVAAA
jgi:hypothetical protein